ncbi:MAG: hypothetical protein CML06_08015 [Pseudomonadales bacterium]|nr:hypothetical protein [Pseudomonadales bacterium]
MVTGNNTTEELQVEVSLPGRGSKTMSALQVVAFAKTLGQQQQWSVAKVLAQQLTEQVPDHLEGWLALFEACEALEDYAMLSRAAMRCLEHKPRCVAALMALATALGHHGRQLEALEIIATAMALEPDNRRLQRQRDSLLQGRDADPS